MDIAGVAVLEPSCSTVAWADVGSAVEAALKHLGLPKKLTVLVNDPQRHTDTNAVLTALAELVPLHRIRVLVACGSHRFGADQRHNFERTLLVGRPFAGVAWHDARNEALVNIGQWRCHPWLLDADALLAAGSVEPHYFAGFTGAHKTCTIGVASYEDIRANHAALLGPHARPGVLDGNPVHEGVLEMLEDISSRRPIAAVNLVQYGRTIAAATGGDVLASLHAAVGVARECFIRQIDAPADAIIAEVTGPLGASFYQADKGIKNNEWAVRDGGAIVLLADCPEGIGQDNFVALLREAPTCAAATDIVRSRGYRLGDHKAVKLRYLTDPACRGVRVYVVSPGLSGEDASALGVRRAGGAEEALASAGIDVARDRVYHLRDAGNLAVAAGGIDTAASPY